MKNLFKCKSMKTNLFIQKQIVFFVSSTLLQYCYSKQFLLMLFNDFTNSEINSPLK